MSYPDVDFIVSLKLSCSIEDAAAKLLGWLRSSVCYDPAVLDGYSIPIEKLPYLESLVFTLNEHLADIREVAMKNFMEAFDRKEHQEAIDALAEKVVEAEHLAEKAQRFLADIDEELSKKGESALVVDQKESKKEDEVYITTKSLQKWASEKYKIDITLLPEDAGYSSSNGPSKSTQKRPKGKRYDALRSELDPILDAMDTNGEKISPNTVMAKLRAKVGAPGTCILNNVGEGVSWESTATDRDNNRTHAVLKIDALGERIATWRKSRK